MAEFHFVQDYEKLIARLLGEMPADEAMAAAVGGDFERVGRIEAAVVRHFGLRDGMTLVDLGCGSGRLAWALGQSMRIDYLGIDMVSAFSVFTHLLHHETYLYMEDIRRVLRPRGRLVFSFLEFADAAHWQQFSGTVHAQRHDMLPHLNQFIERPAIDLWANKLGFEREAFIDGSAAPWEGAEGLHQAIAVLRRP